MKNFMSFDFNIQRISLAGYVAAGAGKPLHRKRLSHGLSLNLGNDKEYFFASGATLTVRQGELIYLPKGSQYHVQKGQDDTCLFINFDFVGSTSFSPFVWRAQDLSKILPAFKAAHQAWDSKRHGYVMKCKEQLYHILYQMQKEYHSAHVTGHKVERIAPAVQYMLENYTAKALRVDELAAMCGITPEYFRTIFQKCYGTSPIKYINQLRVERAKELLLSDSYTVADTAELSGFSDVSYFSKTFKKATGVAPSDFGEGLSAE